MDSNEALESQFIDADYQEYLESQFDEGPFCHSCDGTLREGAITCPCGAVIDEDKFWVDPMPNATFEERMEFECVLEQEERMGF